MSNRRAFFCPAFPDCRHGWSVSRFRLEPLTLLNPASLLNRALTTAVLVTAFVGCAQWKDGVPLAGTDTSPIAQSQEASHRLVLEVEFINASLQLLDEETFTGLWQWVDETPIEADRRQSLLDNGIRVGRVTNSERFEKGLRACETSPSVVDEFLSQASVASEVSHGRQRIPMRLGKRCELALRQPFEGSHVTLVRDSDETIGRTLSNAQYFLALTATASDTAQQIRLKIQPEIQHGAARQKWVSSDTAIRIDTRRETWTLDMLDIALDLSAGDTLAIAPDFPSRGLATKMLTGQGTDQNEQQLVVLIHVAQIPSPADKLAIHRR